MGSLHQVVVVVASQGPFMLERERQRTPKATKTTRKGSGLTARISKDSSKGKNGQR